MVLKESHVSYVVIETRFKENQYTDTVVHGVFHDKRDAFVYAMDCMIHSECNRSITTPEYINRLLTTYDMGVLCDLSTCPIGILEDIYQHIYDYLQMNGHSKKGLVHVKKTITVMPAME
jgi:hypothetical protein